METLFIFLELGYNKNTGGRKNEKVFNKPF